MLLNINRNKSLAILQVIAAVFILLAPSVIGEMPIAAGVYLLTIIFSTLFLARISGSQKIVLSISHFVYLLLGVYVVVTSLWADNKEGNLIYFSAILALMIFHSSARDYFAENITENINRRTLYLLNISGVICSIVNFFYWIGVIVPVAGNTPLDIGIGTNDFLAIFLYFCIFASLALLKGNSKKRKFWLLFTTVGMVFVFALAKSLVAWVFAAIFTLIFLFKMRGDKWFIPASAFGTILFAVFSMVYLTKTPFSGVFPEVFEFGKSHIFGIGGGFWSSRETYMSSEYAKIPQIGLFAYLFAASGIVGVFTSLFLLIKSVILFIRLKSLASVAGLLLCVSILILPFGENIAIIMMLIGLVSYNEKLAGSDAKINLRNETIRKISYATLVVMLVSFLLLLHSVIRTSADNAYSKKDYASAYSLYKVAGTLNISDSESLRMTTVCLRKTGEIAQLHDSAIEIIDRATARDKNNLQNLHEKALIYDACGELELSAQQYRNASRKAYNSDKYNLLLSEQLLKIVKKSPKGSVETKRAYEELIGIAQSTINLDYKKEINDIADEAFKYTKGEIIGEG